jgi:hypothetical protein
MIYFLNEKTAEHEHCVPEVELQWQVIHAGYEIGVHASHFDLSVLKV